MAREGKKNKKNQRSQHRKGDTGRTSSQGRKLSSGGSGEGMNR